jgi:hypothetical protein
VHAGVLPRVALFGHFSDDVWKIAVQQLAQTIHQSESSRSMRVETIQYHNVPEDSVMDRSAHIPVDGMVLLSPPDGGCGLPNCPCFCGHYFMRLFPRDDHGIVFGYIAEFESRAELEGTDEEHIAAAARRAMN